MGSLARTTVALLLAAAVSVVAEEQALAQALQVRWLGHAAFEVVSPGGTRLLIDPWLMDCMSSGARGNSRPELN
jgi:hypothetical protein